MTRCTLLLIPLLLVCLSGCAYHQTAKGWNGRVGFDGEPIFYTLTTKVGMNLFVVIPVFGDTDVDGLVLEVTDHIAERGGDRVRLVEGDSENYWYGFPPFTWIFTPVTATVAAEFRPSQSDFDEWLWRWAGQRDRLRLMPVEGREPPPAAQPRPREGVVSGG